MQPSDINVTYAPASGSMTGLCKYLAASSLSLVTSWTRIGPAEGHTGCQPVCTYGDQLALSPGSFTGIKRILCVCGGGAVQILGPWLVTTVSILFQGYSDSGVGIPRPDCSSEGLDNGYLTWEGDPEGPSMGSLGNLLCFWPFTKLHPL